MYSYLIGALVFLGMWGVVFALVPKSRIPMLRSSLMWGLAGPFSEYWHGQDYWHPTYLLPIDIGPWRFGLEDYLFAFAFGGLCVGVFDFLIRQSGAQAITRFDAGDSLELLLPGAVCLMVISALTLFLQMNSLHAIVLVFFAGAVWVLVRHPAWIAAALQTAVLIGAVMWLYYWGLFFRFFPHLLEQWWRREALSGLSFGGVPVEEVLWAGVSALFVGPLSRECLDRTRR